MTSNLVNNLRKVDPQDITAVIHALGVAADEIERLTRERDAWKGDSVELQHRLDRAYGSLHQIKYANEDWTRADFLRVASDGKLVPPALGGGAGVPKCPRCGRPARIQLMGTLVCDTCNTGVPG
jgi:hypothetical protein